MAVVAHVRHAETRYDELLARGVERWQARERVRDQVDSVLSAVAQTTALVRFGPACTMSLTMAKKRRGHDEEAWRHAKAVCRLKTQQVEMARALGMNPKKLPRLRPTAQERWKLPVGAFIEERYRKRFGQQAQHPEQAHREPRSRQTGPLDAHASQSVQDPMWRAENLVVYLTNLADDLERRLAEGTVAPDVLREVAHELHNVADALNAGGPISLMPEIDVPSQPISTAAPQRDPSHTVDDDDEIPF